MPIIQMNKINQVESPPKPEIKKSSPERDSSSRPEIPKVEFGNDQAVEKIKAPSQTPVLSPDQLAPSTNVVNQNFKKIEAILEEDLSEVYFNLSPQKQQEFKAKGEETTAKIMDLIARPKVQIKKIISLIRDWLKIIPGINVFFLEQVVKIKADKIINETTKRN